MTPAEAALIAGAAFLASVASGVTGAGGAIILSFALAPILGIGAVVQTVSVAMLVSHAARVGAFWGEIDRRRCALVLLGAVPGCLGGALLYTRLDEGAIALVLGLFMLSVVGLRRLLPKLMRRAAPRFSDAAVVALSVGFGLATGATIGGGVLVLPILAGAGLGGAALVATDAAIGLAMHGVKTLVFGSAAVLTGELALTGLLVGLAMVPGAYVARWMLNRLPLRIHGVLVDAIIVAGGLSFLARAWSPK